MAQQVRVRLVGMKKERLWVLGIAAVLALCVVVVVVIEFRAMSSSSIRIVNSGAGRVTHVKCELSNGSGQRWTESFESIEIGESVRITRPISDLFVEGLEYRIGETVRVWGDTGISTTGECFCVEIGERGEVTTSYELKGFVVRSLVAASGVEGSDGE